MHLGDLTARVLAILVFLVAVTAVAELSAGMGVFDTVARLLAREEPGFGVADFVALLWPAALASVVVTVLVLALIFRRSLRGRYPPLSSPPTADRPLLLLVLAVDAAIGPALLLGADVVVATSAAAVVLVVGCLLRRRSLLRVAILPWRLVVGVAVLFVVVQVAHEHGLDDVARTVAGSGTGWLALLRFAAVGGLVANVINNLPGYLALEPAAGGAVRSAVLLVGVGAGGAGDALGQPGHPAVGRPLPRRRDPRPLGRFAARGAGLIAALLVVATTATWLAAP